MNPSLPSEPPKTEPGQTVPDFKSLFCARYQCSPEQFEDRALAKCLCWHARLLAPLIATLSPGFFERDRVLVRYLGSAPGRRHAMNELGGYMEDHEQNGGFVRKFWRLRISSKNTSTLIKKVFAGRRHETASVGGISGQKSAV